jgi:tripartite-type tricarboxylate transporter receptor subunit TctC
MRKALSAFAVLCCLVGTTQAQTYPNRPITMIVPYAAGGPTDTVARIVSDAMARELGQRIIVENVAGAGGTIGSLRAAKSEPNGYTLILNHIGMATAPALYPGSVDPMTSFEFIGQVADVPMTIVAKRSFPAENLKELVEYTVKQGSKVSYAHAGAGTASHICGMLFAAETGATPVNVPYKGTGPAMIDLLGEQVDFMCDQTTNTTNQIKSGEIKAYAVTGPRISSLPSIPSVKEAGLDKLELAIWHGIYTPKGTPVDVQQKLTVALRSALKDPHVLDRFNQLSAVAVSPEQATAEGLKSKLGTEISRWKKILVAEGKK